MVPTDRNTPTAEQARKSRRDEKTRSLLQRRQALEDVAERQRLLEAAVELNLEIAHSIASRFSGRGVESDDVDQVACLGLVKAAHGFDPDAGTPFPAFAVPTIRGEIKRYFRDSSWTVRIPRRLQELQGAIAAVESQLVQELHREPTAAELAQELNADVEEVEGAAAAVGCFSVLSLDRPMDDDDETTKTLVDTVATDDASFEHAETITVLKPLIEQLGERDRQILELRFIDSRTQEDIGREIGVSQMQVSRLLRRILDELREKINMPAAA
jgi:RNA polymerase sigma-B factor